MTPDAAGIEAALTAGLAAHELVGRSVPAGDNHLCRLVTDLQGKPCGCTRLVIGCTGCDWQIEVSDDRVEQFRAHVAAALLPVVTQAQAEAWDGCVQALAWALDNGPADSALPYVAAHNPYRARADESGA